MYPYKLYSRYISVSLMIPQIRRKMYLCHMPLSNVALITNLIELLTQYMQNSKLKSNYCINLKLSTLSQHSFYQ
jgi:hypothetical protein